MKRLLLLLVFVLGYCVPPIDPTPTPSIGGTGVPCPPQCAESTMPPP